MAISGSEQPFITPAAVKRGVVRGTLVNLVGSLATLTVGFFTTPVFVDRLGAEAYGVYALALVFTMGGWFGYLDLGLQGAVVKRAGSHVARAAWSDVSMVAASALVVLVPLGVIFGGAVVLFADPLASGVFEIPARLEPAFADGLRLIGVVLIVQFPALILIAGAQVLQRFDLVVVQRTLATLLGVAVAVVLVTQTGELLALIAPVALAPVLGSALLGLRVRRLMPGLSLHLGRASRQETRALLGLGVGFFLGNAGIILVSQLDQVLIGTLVDARALGLYAIAATPYYAVFMLRAITNATMLPAAVRLNEEGDPRRMQALLLRSTRYAGSLILCGAATGVVWGPDFIEAWVGDEFRESGVLLSIWLGHFAVTAFTGIGENLLPAVGRLRSFVRLSFLLAGVNLVASLALVHPFETRGVIAGTVIAYLVSGPLIVTAILRATGTPTRVFLRRAVLPAAPPVAVVVAVGWLIQAGLEPDHLAAVLAAGAGTFAAGLACAAVALPPPERRDLMENLARTQH